MAKVHSQAPAELPPEEAYALWVDLARWPTFVDGFGHVDRVDDTWPQEGSKLVWRSVPTGRGVVTERVTANEPGARFATRVFDERTSGIQTVQFTDETIALELDYELQSKTPVSRLVDVLFIRRAQRDALTRTLRRFAIEAAEQAAL
jgi:hypothetical protein